MSARGTRVIVSRFASNDYMSHNNYIPKSLTPWNINPRLRKVSFYAIIPVMLTKTKKQRIIKEVAVHDKDTGSSEVQIALLTKKIAALASHLKKNDKDKHSRRGLLSMVADRQTHMKYLEKKDIKRYNAIARKLEIKKV